MALSALASIPAQASEMGPVTIHGFLSQGFMQSSEYDFMADTGEGTFRFNEFGVNFSASLDDKLQVGVQLVSRGLGDLENNTPRLDWAYADYRWQDYLGLKIGKLKVARGFFNETMDIDVARSQIIMPMSVYNLYLRDVMIAVMGSGVYGSIDVGEAGSLSYSAFVGNTPVSTGESYTSYMKLIQEHEMTQPQEERYATGASLMWSSDYGLDLAASYLVWGDVLMKGYMLNADGSRKPMTFERLTDDVITTYSAAYTWENLTLTAEYQAIDKKGDLISTMTTATGTVTTKRYENVSDGWYGQVAYRFTDLFEGSVYYSASYNDVDDRDGQQALSNGSVAAAYQAWQKDWAVTGRFDVTDNWLLKLEAHFMDGAAFAIGQPT